MCAEFWPTNCVAPHRLTTSLDRLKPSPSKRGLLTLIAVLATDVCGCSRHPTKSNYPAEPNSTVKDALTAPPPGASPPTTPQVSPPAATLQGHYEELDAEGAPLLWVPAIHPAPLPLLAVAHGAGGTPRWHCDFWSQQLANRAFVLCLRGKRMGPGAYYYPNHHQLRQLLSAGLNAVRRRYSLRVRENDNVFVGYSQGATMGALVAKFFAKQLTHLLLLEGGFQYWNVAEAQRFRAEGGRSVCFICGTHACAAGSRKAQSWFVRASVPATIVVTQSGHTPSDEVGASAVRELNKLWPPPL